MTVLSLNSIRVSLDKNIVVNDISFEIQPGERLAIIGPNGAGKSSLLNVISGEKTLLDGEARFNGMDLQRLSNRERAKHIAILPQISQLSFPYVVEDVVALGRTPHDSGYRCDQMIVKETMSAMDILHLSGRCYTSLSGGEKQRVQLARVMAQIWREEDASPRLLILDEPTTALDLGHQKLLMDAVVAMSNARVAVLMVMHDINLASRYSHKLLALKAGKQLAFGHTQELLSEDLLQKMFDTTVTLANDPVRNVITVLP